MSVKNKIFIPTLISSATYQPVRTLPHIYFYNGLKDCEDYYIQHYPTGSTAFVETSVQNKFPYLDYYDGLEPSTGSNSLLFFNETPPYGVTPNGSLFTEYWDKYVSLLYNPRTRLIKASAIIPLADYFEMELNDIVQWRGNYYHLRAINDYNLKNGTCKLELLGPIIRDAAQTVTFDCTFNFSSSLAGVIPTTTTTTIAGTTTTLSPTTTTIAPTTTTTVPPTTTTVPPTTTVGPYSVDYLIIAGGAGGGNTYGGGGGAGGYISGSTSVTNTSYTVTVGGGGAVNTNGNDSSVFSLTSIGGGYGGYTTSSSDIDGNIGGSGGGGSYGADITPITGSNGTTLQGTKGGSGVIKNGCFFGAGGGGGALVTGSSYQIDLPGCTDSLSDPCNDLRAHSRAGNGGNGKLWLDGITYAGGGGGFYSGETSQAFGDCAEITRVDDRNGQGGLGGGGNGGWDAAALGTAGTANTGGGGGGGNTPTYVGNSGGSGVVIIRYLGTPKGTGGTITESGGYTYHTFTSSGTFTGGGYVPSPTTTTAAPTTTLAPTTTTTIALNEFSNSGYGNTVNGACSDASINNRTLYSECSSIGVGCTIYTTSGGGALTGYDYVFIDAAVWDINSSTGVITNFSSIQC